MQERFDAKQQELAFLAEEYRTDPALFEQRSFVEGPDALAEFGIYIPGKETFPRGYLKLWPEDFIVEEVNQEGFVYTVADGAVAPESGKGTVFVTLVKCGLSTLEAIADLSVQLNIPKESISYAGIKDKDALTSQRIAIRGVGPESVVAVSSPFYFLKDLEIGKGVIQKGALRGNRFTILIRTPNSLEEGEYSNKVSQSIQVVNEDGFYNFFYLQRFGTPRLCNFYWALSILQGKYKEAVHSILSHAAVRELPYFKKLREQLGKKFGHWDEIFTMLEPFPIMMSHERALVGHLRNYSDDYVGALKTLPEQITLWLYALSSIYFNQKISDYLISGSEPPPELPFFLSRNWSDWEPYKEMLKNHKIYPVPVQNLRRFPQIQIKSRRIKTKDQVKILKGEIVPEGLILQFELGKGQYATSFLSHLFNLVSGRPPEDLLTERVNTQAVLGNDSASSTIKRFERVIHSKGENTFELLMGRE